jgi:hypothetical protein
VGPEADHLPPPSAKVKNVWNYTSTPTILIHGMVFKQWIHVHGVVLS